MKMNVYRFCPLVAALALAVNAFAATRDVTVQLEPHEIVLGESAQLTITVSGNADGELAPPTVPGLEFVAVGQSSQMQSINGVTTSTTTVTYEVSAQRAGQYTIPAMSCGSKPFVLTVRPGNGRTGLASGHPVMPNLPPPATNGLSSDATHLTQGGLAYARLRLPNRELYVGETVPVEIQVGVRAGMVASLNGLPTLNGDAFTLNKLSAQPEQAEETVDGKAFTRLTWRTVLTAIKPGAFSLTVETPLTVRIRTSAQRQPRFPKGFFNDSAFGDDLFDDSFFQDFFGGTTEKEITVASEPNVLNVRPLPTQGRPLEFSDAVGHFEVSAERSAEKTAVGDPFTLRLKVTGTGSFDRVNTGMLAEGNGWKTYAPSAKFTPSDSAGYGGEKVFEQAVISTEPGVRTIPSLAFSFFNPDTQRYETKRTAPLNISVVPASASNTGTSTNRPVAQASASPASGSPHDGLRPDHVETAATLRTLRPLYFQSWFVALQGGVAGAVAAAWVLLRRRENLAKDADGMRLREASRAIEKCLAEMDVASQAGDALHFFRSARSALQHRLATRWHVAPEAITIAEIDAHLNGSAGNVRRVFALADQAAYSGQRMSTSDFQQWKQNLSKQLEDLEAT